MKEKLKQWANKLKCEITALYYATKEDIGLMAKVMIGFTLAYALSPIDLIPDFIPILGYVDDLIILPIFIYISIKMIPIDVMIIARSKAELKPIRLKKNWIMGMMFILVWIALIWMFYLHLNKNYF